MQTVYKPGSFITFVDGKATTFTKDNPFFAKVVDLYKAKKWDKIREYFDLKNYVFKFTQGRVKVGDNVVLFDDKEIHNEVGNRIIQFLKESVDIAPLCKFLENLMSNPEEHVKEDLFLFLENNQLPVTEDGGFIAYKLVKDDYSPYYHSGEERYKVGSEVTFPREKCYNGRTECGGQGLYFGRKEYWNGSFDDEGRYTGSGKMLIVKIMPQDVTSVPSGEQGRKGVCCKMTVLNHYESVVDDVYNRAVFGIKEYVRPEVVEEMNNISEALEDEIIADEYIEKVAQKIHNSYKPAKPARKIMRDAKGHFLSKRAMLARMPKRDKNGRFIAKKRR